MQENSNLKLWLYMVKKLEEVDQKNIETCPKMQEAETWIKENFKINNIVFWSKCIDLIKANTIPHDFLAWIVEHNAADIKKSKKEHLTLHFRKDNLAQQTVYVMARTILHNWRPEQVKEMFFDETFSWYYGDTVACSKEGKQVIRDKLVDSIDYYVKLKEK